MGKGVLAGLFLAASYGFAQTLVGAGYGDPTPISVAPGQIVTLYVSGLTSLTGVTVDLQQNGDAIPAPIQSVRTFNACPGLPGSLHSACGEISAVTIQIPYELIPLCTLCVFSTIPPTLLVGQGDQAGSTIELNPLPDQVHVLTACDIAVGSSAAPLPNLTGLPCASLVTHTNGNLVSASSPASVGEALTIWAFGLGQTNPAAVTGEPAKTSPTAETFNLGFNYQANALAAKPSTGEPDRVSLLPLYAGLASGYVGLYQVNFVVPAQPPNGTPLCTGSATPAAAGAIVQSNLTVSIGGQSSFDGAGICVATQIPVD